MAGDIERHTCSTWCRYSEKVHAISGYGDVFTPGSVVSTIWGPATVEESRWAEAPPARDGSAAVVTVLRFAAPFDDLDLHFPPPPL